MPDNRLFRVLIPVVFVVTLALTAGGADATAGPASQIRARQGVAPRILANQPFPRSLHAEYVRVAAIWIPYTKGRPAGVHAGLIYLRSKFPTCWRK